MRPEAKQPQLNLNSDPLLREMLDAVETAIFLVNPNGIIAYGNRATLNYLGLQSSELSEHAIYELVRGPWNSVGIDGPAEWAHLVRELTSGRAFRGNGYLLRRSGTAVEVELSLQLARTTDLYAIVTARDVSVQLRTQQRIQSAEHRLESVLDSIGDAVVTTDLRGRIEHMNRVAEQLTGYTRDMARGHRLKSIMRVFESSTERPANISRAILESGVVVVFGDQARLETRDERRVSIEGVAGPIRDHNSRIIGVATVFRDWTHERRTRDALKRSEQSFRSLSQSLPVALWVTRAGRIVYANPAALLLTGHQSAKELMGTYLVDLIHETDREQFSQHLQDERPEFRETRVLRQGSSETLAELASMPLPFNGRPGIVTLGRDLTERRALEAQLRVSERMVSIGTLAAGIAHEVNNPLAYVLANLEHIQQNLDHLAGSAGISQVEELRDLVNEAYQGASRVRTIVRDLGTFSRSDDDVTRLVDIVPAIESAVAMAQNEIRHRAQLVRSFAPNLPPVSGNEARLAQVFLNLLINAAQALEDGEAGSNRIRIKAFAADNSIYVEISDTGPGVPEELKERIFDPFFTTKSVGEGVGLGLSICHSIVSAYSGQVTLLPRSQDPSGESWGSTFQVQLPAVAALSRPVHIPTPYRLKLKGGRILIIDDEPIVLKALRRILREHEVEFAHSGKEAIEILIHQEKQFDVIICDIMMPEVSGLEVYHRVQESSPSLARRMLFMTGGAFTHSARDFLANHPDRWFEKPFDRARVLSLVQELLYQKSSQYPKGSF